MSTVTITRQLVERRYGLSLTELQRAVRFGTDPVLPVVLRRLAGLADTHEQARVARSRLDATWRHRNSDHALDKLVASATDVIELEARQCHEAEVIWDLLDIRLLLDHSHTISATRAFQCDDQVVEQAMPAARKVAAGRDLINRQALRQGLRQHGIRLSNRRLGTILSRLRAERSASF